MLPICEVVNIEETADITTKLNLIELKSPLSGVCSKSIAKIVIIKSDIRLIYFILNRTLTVLTIDPPAAINRIIIVKNLKKNDSAINQGIPRERKNYAN